MPPSDVLDNIKVVADPYAAAKDAHAVAVLTEWDEFKAYDYQKVYDSMSKPAFIFDGRNILDHEKLRQIGFVVFAIGKPLDPVCGVSGVYGIPYTFVGMCILIHTLIHTQFVAGSA